MSSKKQTTERRHANRVARFDDGYWEWFESNEPAPYKILGKYLFFSEERDLLVEIAHDELQNGGFHRAKTHMVGVAPPSGEYVLCLYYKDDGRKHELAAKYRGRPNLKYRYWKSDVDTRQGKYSQEFLNKARPELRTRLASKQDESNRGNGDVTQIEPSRWGLPDGISLEGLGLDEDEVEGNQTSTPKRRSAKKEVPAKRAPGKGRS